MLATQCNNLEVVNELLAGSRAIDDQAFSSIAILAERLERLRKTSSLFGDITFSPHVEELASHEMILAIC